MIAKVASGGAQYFLSDRLSERVVLDSSGNVSGRMAHLPFGEDFGESGTQEKHHFTNYERNTENDYAVNRSYMPATGRFQQSDPYVASGRIVNPQSWNRYSYVRGDVVNREDLLGLQDTIVLKGWDYYDRPDPNGGVTTGQGIASPGGSGSEEFGIELPGTGGEQSPGETVPTPYEYCTGILFEELAYLSGAAGAAAPDINQYAAAEAAANAGGANLSLLLTTWFLENRFSSQARNNPNRGGPGGMAYGPMQLQEATIAGLIQGTGFTLSQVTGSRQRIFDGDLNANLTIGSKFLAALTNRVGGDLALAGTAFLGQNYVVGRTPDQLTGGYKSRYDSYATLLPMFDEFVGCVERAKQQ
jgi:RHS repeat-associated protein